MNGTTLGDAEGTKLSTYDDKEIRSLEGFTYGTADVKFCALLLGSIIGLVDGIKIGTYEVIKLVFWDGKLLVTTLGAITTWCI